MDKLYRRVDNKLVLEMEKPEIPKKTRQADGTYVANIYDALAYEKQFREWKNRPSYPINPDHLERFNFEDSYELDKHFNLYLETAFAKDTEPKVTLNPLGFEDTGEEKGFTENQIQSQFEEKGNQLQDIVGQLPDFEISEEKPTNDDSYWKKEAERLNDIIEKLMNGEKMEVVRNSVGNYTVIFKPSQRIVEGL